MDKIMEFLPFLIPLAIVQFVNVKSSAPHKSCAAVHWRRLL